ncbi:interleukin-1 receptor-like 1 [Labeo rohita]|uniref:Interleukin-1 receptor-like 1 n=1 Tax=Labeo rohita TaxID=84645 RepID=A0A498MD08_LABRO|nr:interleukin-1 receptor-like 1 [Labeo rohita]
MKMMMLQIILLLTEFVLVSSYSLNSTVQCEYKTRVRRKVRAGESLYLDCPNLQCHSDTTNSSYLWFRNLSVTNQMELIGTEESERVHYHESGLYILGLNLNDTGRYITQWWYEEDQCAEYETDVVVYEEFSTDLLYPDIVQQETSEFKCPVCEYQQGSFIWYKNFSLIPNQESFIRIRKPSKQSEGIYTCVCTWEHNGTNHNTSGSRRLIFKEQTISSPPKFLLPINNSIVSADVDGKLYDAYVIYQRNNLDETTSKAIGDFVNGSLLTVLESYYGFKLFIHGRDDLPGEGSLFNLPGPYMFDTLDACSSLPSLPVSSPDCMSLIEAKIQLSRRLIIILTPRASADKSSVSSEAYDLQLGLYQALVQGETSVILIQLGKMQDYTHLPLGLQHLLRKTSPLLWKDSESSPTSRFWKQVRYQMPAASSCQRSLLV